MFMLCTHFLMHFHNKRIRIFTCQNHNAQVANWKNYDYESEDGGWARVLQKIRQLVFHFSVLLHNKLFYILIFCCHITQADGKCHFEGYVALCNVKWNRITTHVTAIVNHCHKPVDVTFIIKSENNEPPVNWRYTFVSTNPHESSEITQFQSKDPVFLSVYFPHHPHNSLRIQAHFHVNNFDDIPVINSTVNILPNHDCMLDSDKTGRLTLGIVLTVILLAICAGIIGWICYRKKQTGERVALVDDMEVDILSSSGKGSSNSTSSTICASDSKDSDQNFPSETISVPLPS